MDFIKDWVLPIFSVILSIWFASSAKKDAEKADELLEKITSAINTWQTKIIDSTINILDSLPQVVEGRNNAAKMKAIESLIKITEERISNQDGLSPHGYAETLKALTGQMSSLLEREKK